jgi:plastocyanin
MTSNTIATDKRITAAVSGQVAIPTAALLLAALALTAVMIVNEQVIPPLAAFALILTALAGATLRWRGKRWLHIVAATFAAVILAGTFPVAAEDLAHPETFLSFFPTLLGVVALAVAVLAAIQVARRRSETLSVIAGACGAAVLAAGVALSLVATLGTENDAQAAGDVVIVAEDIEYPERVALTAGERGIFIENKDRVRHTFVIDGQAVKLELPGSTNRRLEVDLAAGEYRFHCTVAGHERMEGTLIVT